MLDVVSNLCYNALRVDRPMSANPAININIEVCESDNEEIQPEKPNKRKPLYACVPCIGAGNACRVHDHNS